MRRGASGLVILVLWVVSMTSDAAESALAQNGPAGATATGKGGAVASVAINATRVGIDVLKAGGNAIDAAVAAAAALGVVEPYSCGVGGGGFMLIYLKEQNRVITLDGRETAPASANANMFRDPASAVGNPLNFSPERVSSGLAVGVPGTLLTWTEALSRYGTMSLDKLLAPAIKLAEEGFEVDATLAAQTEANRDRFAAFISTSALYLPNGKPLRAGAKFKNPDLAKTYRLIAERGSNVFYRGEIGRAIVDTVRRPPTIEKPPFKVWPGGMTLADLDNYTVRIHTPIFSEYRGYKVYGMGLPSSGGIAMAQALNLLEGFDMKADRVKGWNYLIEAQRLVFADRNAYIGDPEFVDVPLAGLLSKDYAKERRALIGDRAPAGGIGARARAGDPLKYQKDASPSKTGSDLILTRENREGSSTTHLTVADKAGNVVSYTFTIESTGGSGMVVPGYGFLLNNELTDFDIPAPHPNSPEAGKKPRSSMAPTIVLAPDGRVLAFGSPGGSTIITTVQTIFVNMVDYGLALDQAIAAPRISQRNSGPTQVDGDFEKSKIGMALVGLGHVFQGIPTGSPTGGIGAATGIVVNPDGTMVAAAEPVRRGGGSAMVVEPGK